MSFNPNVPNASQSPGLFPTQNNNNFSRLQTIIEADHVFNATAQSNDGIHKQVKLLNAAVPVALVNGENGIHFATTDSLGRSVEWYYNGVTYYPLNSIKCFVNFNGSDLSIRSEYNVASIIRWNASPGRYRITFATPFVSSGDGNKYITVISAMHPNTNIIANVRSNSTLTASQTNLYVDIETVSRDSGTYLNPVYVGVTINSIL